MKDFTRRITGATIRGAVFVAVLFAVRGWAATDPEAACQAGRTKAAGKYANCIQGEVSKSPLLSEDPAKFHADFVKFAAMVGKCVTKYAKVYDKLHAAAQKSGGSQTCDAARFVDNADGTVTDNLSALVWEKKTNLDFTTNFANPHDADNYYAWSATGTAADGPAFTSFLAALNGAGFAGQYDWRLPTIAELMSITQPTYPLCMTPPCIDATFGPTRSEGYWSDSTYQPGPINAWAVFFSDGSPGPNGKPPFVCCDYARAVRGGF